jgi:hypothetical protein
MGVSYYTCESCKRNFPDCGEYGYCKCGAMICDWCFDQAVFKHGQLEEEEADRLIAAGELEEYVGNTANACPICTLETITDETMLNWLLKQTGKTRKQVEKEMRNAKTA